jgi:Tfp pilus assembly protein PilF
MIGNGTIRGAARVACLGTLLLGCSAPRQDAPAQESVPAETFGSADGYYTLGRSEHAAAHAPLARRAYEAALRINPRHRAARNGLAVVLAEGGDYAGAIALWRQLLTQSAGLPPAEQGFLLGNLGYALYLKGDREEAVTMLVWACLRDPLQPLTWEHLAAVLHTLGQTDLALQMMRQARILRTHDLRGDYAAAGGKAPPAAAVDGAQDHTLWPADLARTEVRAVGGAVVEVRRVPPQLAPAAVPAPAPAPVPGTVPAPGLRPASVPVSFAVTSPETLPVSLPASVPASVPAAPADAPAQSGLRLEISNGNGVRGMAAAWARDSKVTEFGWKSVRLTNTRPFAVPVTRLEYGAQGEELARVLSQRLGLPAPRAAAADARADLRIVLGWDQRATAPATPQATTQAP